MPNTTAQLGATPGALLWGYRLSSHWACWCGECWGREELLTREDPAEKGHESWSGGTRENPAQPCTLLIRKRERTVLGHAPTSPHKELISPLCPAVDRESQPLATSLSKLAADPKRFLRSDTFEGFARLTTDP